MLRQISWSSSRTPRQQTTHRDRKEGARECRSRGTRIHSGATSRRSGRRRETGHRGRGLRRNVSLPPVRRHRPRAWPRRRQEVRRGVPLRFLGHRRHRRGHDRKRKQGGDPLDAARHPHRRVKGHPGYRQANNDHRNRQLSSLGRGKVVESCDSLDQLGMLRQVGVSALQLVSNSAWCFRFGRTSDSQ